MENKSEEVVRPGGHCQLLNDLDIELQLPSADPFHSQNSFFGGLLPVSLLILTSGAAF